MAKQAQVVKKGAKTGAKTGPKTKSTRKKVQRIVPVGIVHVNATFNNTNITITDQSGNVIAWATAGKAGYTGSRKSSGFAATMAAQDAAKRAAALGMKEAEVNLKGAGSGRESAVRGIISAGIAVTVIRDKTPVPHNGCRPKKRRRV